MPVKAKPTARKAVRATSKTVKVGNKAAAVKAKPVAAAKVAAPPPEPKWKAGDLAIFKGYRKNSNYSDNPMFAETGVQVYIHSTTIKEIESGVGKGRKIVYYRVCPADQAEAAAKDPNLKKVDVEELTAGELRELKIRAPEPEYHPVAHPTVAKLVKANQLTDEIKKLLAQEAQTEFQIGGLLAFVRYERPAEITELGYTDTTDEQGNPVSAWVNYLRDEFGISERTGEAYVAIYKRFSSIPGFDPKVLSKDGGVGWSKAAMIANYVPLEGTGEERKAKADEIIELAAATDIRSLRAVMKERYVSDGTTPAGTRVSTRALVISFGPFKLTEADAAGVKMIMEQASKTHPGLSDNPSAIFAMIVRQWGTQNLGGPVLARVNKAFEPKGKPSTVVKPVGRKITPRAKPTAAASASA